MISAKSQVSKDMNSSMERITHTSFLEFEYWWLKGMMTPLLSYKSHPFLIDDFFKIAKLISNVALNRTDICFDNVSFLLFFLTLLMLKNIKNR